VTGSLRATALALAAVVGLAEGAAAQAVRVDGSSTVYPISREAARRFMRSESDARIEVAFAGTTGGFAAFCAGDIEISNASRPIDAAELARCALNEIDFIELPIAVDALTIVVHPDNDWARHLTIEELRRIWEPAAEGQITNWSQVRQGFPDRPLVLFGRGQASGTYDYFTGAVVGEVRASRLDYTASEDIELLVESIAAEPDALGFFGIGGFAPNYELLKDVAVDSGNGHGSVFANIRDVQAGRYQPLTRPLFLYVNAARAAENPTLRRFVEFYLDDVARWVVFTGYMPLDEGAYAKAQDHFKNRRTGSAFGGITRYDLTIQDILSGEAAAAD
jgi:phosphate transport system substrate-binding protein